MTKIPATLVHVTSVVLGMGGALVSDVLFSFFGKDKKLNKTEINTLDVLSKLVFYSLFVIIFSGLFIFLGNIDKYINSAKFLSKMSILAVLLINGYFLNKYVWPHLLQKNFFTLKRERNVRRLAFACGAISVVSWLSVCLLGVLDNLDINYGLIMSLYAGVIFVSILVALTVEKREFN